MLWKKLGLLFSANHQFSWMISHASQPFPELLGNGLVKVYFNTRNEKNQSSVGWVILNMHNSFVVTAISNEPVIVPGTPGLFDDSGVSAAQILSVHHSKKIYYVGWNLKVSVPWQNSIGLAVYDAEKNTFQKFSVAPVMDRSHTDPYSLSYPFVLFEDKTYKMWYGSNLGWGSNEQDMQHVIKYTESEDGIHWKRNNHIAIGLAENEFAVARPFVQQIAQGYSMWYSYRSLTNNGKYRIGYAISADGKNWQRKDGIAGIDVSETGWDSEMVCYASLFKFEGKMYMLYNGNGYGKTGFGIAVLAEGAF